MFAYCLNNIANMKDENGNDAIWIQEGNSAAGEGHSGLMVQDEEGKWWYFYWGPEDETPRIDLILGVESGSYLDPITVSDCDLSSTEGVIKAIDQSYSGESKNNRANLITSTRYFTGNYVATYKKALEFAESSEKYNVLLNNCVQKTLAAFMESDYRFGLTSYGDYKDIIPNYVYNRVIWISQNKEDVPWTLCILKP